MEKTFALYCGDGRVSKAFERLEEAFLCNYDTESSYGLIIDPAPSAVYKSVNDSVLLDEVRRGVEKLSHLYGKRFFAMLRERKYNALALRNGYYRYACEGGFFGASEDFFRYLKGECSAFVNIFGERDFGANGFVLDHSMWSCGSLRCDFLQRVFDGDGFLGKARGKTHKCSCLFWNGKLNFLRAEELFTFNEQFLTDIPSREESFLLKSSAVSASKYFFKMYDGEAPLPETLRGLLLTLCAVISMKMFSCFGEAESLELADRAVRKMKAVISLFGDLGINGDDFLLLSAVGEGLCDVMTEPEFILLKSEILEIKAKLVKMHKSRFGGELSGALCCKELAFRTPKIGKISRVLLFSLTAEEFSELLSGRLGRCGAEFNAEVLICAAQRAFCAPFLRFLQKNKEFSSRKGLLCELKRAPMSDIEVSSQHELLRSTQFAGELLEHFEALRGVKSRLVFAGASKSELPYIAYLENCVKNQSLKVTKSVCFACDRVSELVLSLAHASRAVPNLIFTVVTPDAYGAKKLSELSPRVKALPFVSAEGLKITAKENGFFRQLTPYSTLNELMCEQKMQFIQ